MRSQTQALPRQAHKPRSIQDTLIFALGQTAYMSFVLNHAVEACVSDGQEGQTLQDVDVVLENIRVVYRSLQSVARYLES